MSQFTRLSSIVFLAAALGSQAADVVLNLPIVNKSISPDGFARGYARPTKFCPTFFLILPPVLFSLEEAGLVSEASAVALAATGVVAVLVVVIDRLGDRLPEGTLPWRF